MEPSAFGYKGLENQRDGGGYDNFLRSNIDNEQDKRNFVTELGRDHLPFRTWEGQSLDNDRSHQTKIPNDGKPPGPVITVTPGEPYLVPLRWNNPHSSELEVNIWIMDNKYVVPIRKPTCSGEGHQDNVFSFTVPTNFNQLGSRIPGFYGCKKRGDCVLQVYAHSVESRTYASGVPLVVTGDVPAFTATSLNVEEAKTDVGLVLDSLRDVCLGSNDPSANILTAVPRKARLVSDVFNHAYQNSDFSPYSGQQPEAISKNLQASAILKMVTGNRGELGKAKLRKDNREAANFQKIIEKKAKKLVQFYESITNQIIAAVGEKMANTDTTLPYEQKTATCFRCAEVGAINSRRLTTNTYIPSFQIPPAQVDEAKQYIAPIYSHLVDNTGKLKIYEAVLSDMSEDFVKASALGLNYLPAVIKTTTTTMADKTGFRKIDAAGNKDNGYYAATEAAKAYKASGDIFTGQIEANANPYFANAFKDPDSLMAEEGLDMDGLNYDSKCDDDKLEVTEETDCSVAGYFTGQQWFVAEDNVLGVGSGAAAFKASWTLLLALCAVAAALN